MQSLRRVDKLHEFRTFGGTTSSLDVSQSGIVAIGFGSHVEFWKPFGEKPAKPYMAHNVPGQQVKEGAQRYEHYRKQHSHYGLGTP